MSVRHLLLISPIVLFPLSSLSADLGVIHVESSTIDDRFAEKRQEPSNTAMISGETVDRAHAENIHQILQSVPGLTTEFDSGDTLKIHIRGVENQMFMGEKPGVAVVIDGVPVFERTGKVNIDLDNIESIKVIKGGASYLFGEDALGGAVIITTKRGADMAGTRVGVEMGSYGFDKQLVRTGLAAENYAGHIQISRRSIDGYYFQSDYQTDYVNGKFQYYLDDVSDLTFGFELSDREKDSHGSVTGVTQAEEDPQSVDGRDFARMFDVALAKTFVTYSRDMDSDSNLMLNLYRFTDNTNYMSRPVTYDGSYNDVSDNVNAYAENNDYDQVQQGLKAEFRSGGNTLAWMGGVDLRANEYSYYNIYAMDFARSAPSARNPTPTVYTEGTVFDDNHTDESVQALYGELKLQATDATTVTLNSRYDAIALDYADDLNDLSLDKSFQVWSWRLGANHALSGNTDLYTNYSTGFRTPTVEQLFAGDISPFGDTASNHALDPEHSTNIEIGLRGRGVIAGVGVEYDVAAFQLDRRDFIMAVAGNYANPETGTKDQYDNIGGARNRGLELALHSDRQRDLFVDIAYTYLESTFTDYEQYNLVLGNRWSGGSVVPYYDLEGNDVPRVPRHHLNVSLNGRVNNELILTAETDTATSYYADDINQIKIDGHTVVNLMVSYDTKLTSGNRLELFARIDNAFDEDFYNTARSVGDNNEDGVYNEEDLSIVVNQGRTFTVGLAMEF